MSELCPVCGQPDNCGDCNHHGTPHYVDSFDRPALACHNCGNPDELWGWYSVPERQTITVWDEDGAVKYDYTGITEGGEDAGPDESYYCGNCFTHADTIEELVGREAPAKPMDDKAALDAIWALLSGTEWSADTIEGVAAVVGYSGREIADYEGPVGG